MQPVVFDGDIIMQLNAIDIHAELSDISQHNKDPKTINNINS